MMVEDIEQALGQLENLGKVESETRSKDDVQYYLNESHTILKKMRKDLQQKTLIKIEPQALHWTPFLLPRTIDPERAGFVDAHSDPAKVLDSSDG